MSTPLPPAQHGAVLAGIKATPCGWPRPALTPAAGGAHQQGPGARPREGSDKFRSLRFQGIAEASVQAPGLSLANRLPTLVVWLSHGLRSTGCRPAGGERLKRGLFCSK